LKLEKSNEGELRRFSPIGILKAWFLGNWESGMREKH
jgi:hypothetical protein